MAKVVINRCHGGFALSWLATLWLAARGYEEAIHYSSTHPADDNWFTPHSLARHNVDLVAVVEQLGERAQGEYAELSVVEVDGPYRIEEYDGYESVRRPEDLKWCHTDDPQILPWNRPEES